MLSERTIQNECRSSSFARGLAIMLAGHYIYDTWCEYGKYTTVMGYVESSSGYEDGYDVSVTVDEPTDRIIDYDCTCPAHRKYAGMCKHAAALALTFREHPEKFVGSKVVRQVTTSPSVKALLKRSLPQASVRRGERAIEPGSIRLELELADDYNGLSARFKIASPTASYVLKSIDEFLIHVKENEYFSYGKKLAFTHTMTAFTRQTQGVIRLLQRITDADRARHQRLFGYRPHSSYTTRDLYLSDADAIDMIDLYADEPFDFEDGYSTYRRPKPAHVAMCNPPLDLAIDEIEGGGYEIKRTRNLRIIQYAERAYAIIDHVFYHCSEDFMPAIDFLQTVYCGWDDTIAIAEEDAPAFSAAILPILEQCLAVDAPPTMKALKPVPCQLQFYLDKAGQECECRAVALYGDIKVNALDPAPHPGVPVRDVVAEDAARALVMQFLPVITPAGNAITNGDEDAGRLLFGGVAELRRLGEVFTTPAFDRLVSATEPRVTVGVSLAGNLINLQVKTTELDPLDLAKLLASYRQRKHYHRLRDGSYLSLLGTEAHDMGLEEMDRIYKSLDLTDRQLADGEVSFPRSLAFLVDNEVEDDRKDESFSQFIHEFRDIPTKKHPVPRALAATLRPYQVDGYHWLNLLADTGLGGILADEMGLGKSLQVITWLLHHRADLTPTPALIVCPASLVYNWVAEFGKFAPDVRVRAVSGTKSERVAARADVRAEVMVTSYDSLRIDVEEWAKVHAFACVIDEAQYIKNHATQVARSVKKVNADHRLALTGTPIENRLSELWSIFDYLMPGMLGPYNRFKERYELPIVGGDEDASSRLRALVGPFILRRRKQDVLTDLPDKLEQTITCQMGSEQLRLYDAHEQRLRMELDGQSDQVIAQDKIAVLAELTKLRQICCDPRLLYDNYKHAGIKMEAIEQLVSSAWEAGEKVLIFSQFTSFLSLIGAQLTAARINYFTITGATPKKKRLELVDRFNVDDTPAFLISLKAGGTGLNLTGASVVIHADPWWNKAAQSQATDRAHRIGQQRTVTVYQVIAANTIEERILKLQQAKSELADAVLAGDSKSLGSLSKDELIALLSEG